MVKTPGGGQPPGTLPGAAVKRRCAPSVYGTNCHHEHACLRCALLRPDPAQSERLRAIIANLHDRIGEAEQDNWLGEAKGLKTSLAIAKEKLVQMEQLADPPTAPILLQISSPQAPAIVLMSFTEVIGTAGGVAGLVSLTRSPPITRRTSSLRRLSTKEVA